MIASAISGTIGLLGDEYSGYFPVGETVRLGQLLARAETDARFTDLLKQQCATRRPLFEPAREQQSWAAVLKEIQSNEY